MLVRGDVLLIQPHQYKRPHIAIVGRSKRQPVAALINPEFQPRIDAANAAIQMAIEREWFEFAGRSDHHFRVRLENPNQLRSYLHLGARPPRFPVGGKKRFDQLWRRSPSGAQIEVTEYLTVIALRPAGDVTPPP